MFTLVHFFLLLPRGVKPVKTPFLSGICETFSSSENCENSDIVISGQLCQNYSDCRLECLDVDECNNETCEAKCTNTRNGFECSGATEHVIDLTGFSSWKVGDSVVEIQQDQNNDGTSVSCTLIKYYLT